MIGRLSVIIAVVSGVIPQPCVLALGVSHMAGTLVKQLRTCPAEHRRFAALKLAENGTDEDVRELIRMVEGRRRSWFFWYDYEDQLTGVEALGDTGSRKALEYLKFVYQAEHRTEIEGMANVPMDKHEQYMGRIEVEYNEMQVVVYPNARGTLRESLDYRTIQNSPLNARHQQAHRTMQRAIEKLEQAVASGVGK